MGVAVGGDGGDLGDLLACGDVLLVFAQVLDDSLDSSLSSSPQVHGVAAGSDVLDRLGEDGVSEDRGSGGSVTSDLVGLGGNILEQAGTQVLELVLERDGSCDGYTIWDCEPMSDEMTERIRTLCNLGRAVARLDEDIAALGTEGCGDGPGECLDAGEQSCAAFYAELELLCGWSAESIYACDECTMSVGVPCGKSAAAAG